MRTTASEMCQPAPLMTHRNSIQINTKKIDLAHVVGVNYETAVQCGRHRI